MSKLLTDEHIIEAAKSINVEFEALKAVAIVESCGKGFLPNGEPTILFESKVFRTQLRNLGLNPDDYMAQYSDVVRKNPKPHGSSLVQHARLRKAAEINRNAALQSASWGMFQVMGFNWKLVGYATLQDFINAMYRSEVDHLHACVCYCKARRIVTALRNHEWTKFAEGYNGKGQVGYDVKLAMEYEKLVKVRE